MKLQGDRGRAVAVVITTTTTIYLLDSENLTDIMPRALYALSYLILSTAP